MGLLRKLFSIPAKFGRIFSFYNKYGIVSRILTLLGAVIFTIATIFLEKWAFSLFADNYIWGILALIFSFSIGLGCAEFLIMCCVTAVLSTLKSSVVDTARFISKKSKEKKEKNSDKKDKSAESELNSEGLAELRAAESQVKKSSKDVGVGFKDAVTPDEWEKITNVLQTAGQTANLDNVSLVQTVLEAKQEVENSAIQNLNEQTEIVSTQNSIEQKPEETKNSTEQVQSESIQNANLQSQPVVVNQNLSVQNQPEITVQIEDEQVVKKESSVEITAQNQPENAVINPQIITESVNNAQQNIDSSSQPQKIENVAQTHEVLTGEDVVESLPNEVKEESEVQSETTNTTLQTEESTNQEQPTTENIEETKNGLEEESKKIENLLDDEKSKAEELEQKKKKSHKIFDIFCAIIFAFLGFVVVTQYIAIFKANANELKFWEKIDFGKILEYLKFWEYIKFW